MISFDIHYIVRYIREHKFLFFTYLIMLFVPFIAFVFCLFSADSIMRKDALQYQNSILQHEKSICDNMMHNTKIAINTASLETNENYCKTRLIFLRNPYSPCQNFPRTWQISNAIIPTSTVLASTFVKTTHS